MSRFRFRMSLSHALGVALVAFMAVPAHAQPTRRFDTGKFGIIEMPAKIMVARSMPYPMPRPVPIPRPAMVQAVVQPKPASVQTVSNVKPSPAPTPPISKPTSEAPVSAVNSLKSEDTTNPTVAPGDVKWHASFADACAAARKSGKPVLLFHLMGQLDKQFC